MVGEIAAPKAGRTAWQIAAAVFVLGALAARIHGIASLPAVTDFDAPGHLLNAYWMRAGRLPPVDSWLGFHPPLYHAASAAVWSALPEAVPVHVGMRLISLLCGVASIAVTWSVLRRRYAAADAAVVAALLGGLPVLAISMTMLGNETMCALFSTVVLARLAKEPAQASGARSTATTALAAAFAALAKSTGWLAVAIAASTYALRERARPRRALAAAALVVVLALALAGPFYARIVQSGGGSPMSVVSAAASSPDLALMMSRQPPGERHASDYWSVPASTFLRPRFDQPGMLSSVPGLLYASIWADAHGHYIPWLSDEALLLSSVTTIGGLVPSLLIAVGALRLLRRPRPGDLAALAFAGLLLGSLLRYAWMLPTYSAVKASYLLPAMLPASLALGAGLDALSPRARVAARALLLALSGAGTLLTAYGLWGSPR